MSRRKIYSICTDELSRMKNVFINTIQDDWDINIEYLGRPGDGNSDVLNRDWLAKQTGKTALILQKIEANLGDIIIWSDLGVQFFSRCTPYIDLAMQGKDVVYLAEHGSGKEVNPAFAVIRCNDKTLALYRSALSDNAKGSPVSDHTMINKILSENKMDIAWDILPGQFWAMSHYMCNFFLPPYDVALHHANCLNPVTINDKKIGSVELGLQQLEMVRKYIFTRPKPEIN